jgi:hypothetical protein
MQSSSAISHLGASGIRGALAIAVSLALELALFWSAQAAEADPMGAVVEPKRAVIPKLHGTIRVDGEVDEPVWKDAAILTPFFKNNGSGRERETTQVRVWYDETALYLGWTCQDSDIEATLSTRDSKFWEEEVVEFFVTAKELTRYFELQWNPLGGVFDAIIYNELDERGLSRKMEGDWSFTAKGMKSAVKVKGTIGKPSDRDEFWQVEVMIPFADLGTATPKDGDIWRANFYRFNRGNGLPVEEVSWSPTLTSSFHQPSRFGYLQFGGASVQPKAKP